MVLKKFADCVGLRTLRSGRLFSQYYLVPDDSFDLDALGLAAAEREMDEEVVEEGNESGNGTNEPPSPAPASPPAAAQDLPPSRTPCSSPFSPLSSLASTPCPSRSGSPAPRSPSPPRVNHAIKGGGRKRRSKEQGRRNRAKKRKASVDAATLRDRLRHQAKRIARSQPKRVEYKLDAAPVTSTGFRGLYEEGTARNHSREELINDGFVYFPWDGRETTPLVAPLPVDPPPNPQGQAPAPSAKADDAREASGGIGNAGDGADEGVDSNVVIGVCAGRPSDGERSGRAPQQTWDESTGTLADAIENGRGQATFSQPSLVHRRGLFGAQACGISHGGGQLRPANLKHNAALTLVLMYLIALPAMVRVAHFSSSVFANWAPKVHDHYGTTLLALLQSDATLTRNFARSVWACITINFGPRTVTFPHRDYANLPFGWCAITALGNYDPDKGGDLVLWDCKMIIRFPPGSTILIPSAILRHSNTRVGPNEHRYSVTQYSAGALFRWVAHGFQLDEFYYASLSAKERADERRTAAGRWRRGRAMFSRFGDLVAAAEKKL